MSEITLYGISNCDTVRKARKWLDAQGVDYRFHDFRKDGMESVPVATWLEETGPDQLINRRGTTWRGLSEQDKSLQSHAELVQLIRDNPAIIKRPVLDIEGSIHLGFSEQRYADLTA